jgi:hypothetical protein
MVREGGPEGSWKDFVQVQFGRFQRGIAIDTEIDLALFVLTSTVMVGCTAYSVESQRDGTLQVVWD